MMARSRLLSNDAIVRAQRHREFENRPRIVEALTVEFTELIHSVTNGLWVYEQVGCDRLTLALMQQP